MSAIGLFFLPLEANSTSPFTALSQHVSRKLTAQPLPAFWLEYRLLVDTSSLLPGALDTRKRRTMQILTLSQFPEKTYVLTEPENSAPPSMVSMPTGAAANTFFSMVTTKMQPLWGARNDFRVEKGTSVEFNAGEVSTIRVGELRVTVGQGAGKTRGVVIELSMRDDWGDEDAEDMAAREVTLRAAFDATFRGSRIDTSNAKLVQRTILAEKEEPERAETIRLYAELMQVAAPVAQR